MTLDEIKAAYSLMMTEAYRTMRAGGRKHISADDYRSARAMVAKSMDMDETALATMLRQYSGAKPGYRYNRGKTQAQEIESYSPPLAARPAPKKSFEDLYREWADAYTEIPIDALFIHFGVIGGIGTVSSLRSRLKKEGYDFQPAENNMGYIVTKRPAKTPAEIAERLADAFAHGRQDEAVSLIMDLMKAVKP